MFRNFKGHGKIKIKVLNRCELAVFNELTEGLHSSIKKYEISLTSYFKTVILNLQLRFKIE